MARSLDEASSAGPPDPPGKIWMVVAFIVYVALGFTLKAPVLNWVVGPLWLLVILHLMPSLFRRIGGARGKL